MANDKEPARESTAEAREAASEMARTGESGAREAAETTKRGARTAARTGEEMMARRGEEMLARRGEEMADTARETANRMANETSRTMSEATEQLNRIFALSARTSEEMANQASQNLDVMMQCGSILADGYQKIWREWMNYAQQALQRNMDGLNNMMRSRSLPDLVQAQSELLREEMEMFFDSSIKISELSARVANDTVQRISERSEEGARAMRRQSAS